MDRCYKGKNPYLDPVYERCTYTNDKKMLPESDALLFRGRRMADIAAPHDQRRGNQYWVFWEFEPPYKVWWDANLTHFDGVFNMTATYSRDSDVPNMHYLDNICIPNAKKAKQLRKVDYTWKKTQGAPIVWFASVCITQSRREKYVKELQKHIKVDIYGDCGPKKCGSNKQATWPQDKCDEYAFHSNESYKFYLAFENSLCDDYVTEKLWKTIVPPLDTVPIVFGSVDYANILPRNSYIDVRDFASPKKLAAYIKHLDANDELYNQYLRNKHSLNCRLVQRYMPWHCRLCKNLHRMEGQKKVIYDLGRFWGSRRCQSPIDFHDNRRANWDFRQ
ncbi:hypothetical protein CAPTEDRAFT_113412 [Capitella teleta]|uniref:Fucosyltransferase n=1 Tax=Capitella teleta TaxID=283909 RepID=R7TQ28_CAPTE|nr:hypothetical protein CAPTEDRAFT_113412 [Capitella teleta]|eukprot:ELT95998.1 hypothetical protein CAPTEDRAFT_113412 [Capitella teleta]